MGMGVKTLTSVKGELLTDCIQLENGTYLVLKVCIDLDLQPLKRINQLFLLECVCVTGGSRFPFWILDTIRSLSTVVGDDDDVLNLFNIL